MNGALLAGPVGVDAKGSGNADEIGPVLVVVEVERAHEFTLQGIEFGLHPLQLGGEFGPIVAMPNLSGVEAAGGAAVAGLEFGDLSVRARFVCHGGQRTSQHLTRH